VAKPKPEPPVDPFSQDFKRLLHTASGGRYKPVASVAPSAAVSASHSCGLREGSMIEHQRFGIGKVVRLEGTGDNEKATVEFRNAGTKQLLLKFAKYKVID
jgi:DNA helicase-2/ATP-dependent DNA helicase PcrA